MIEMCRPHNTDDEPSLLNSAGVEKGCLPIARSDAMLVYKASRSVEMMLSLATTTASAMERDELEFRHLTKRERLAVIILALEFKLPNVVSNAAQAVFMLSTMQRHLGALGIKDQVCFAIIGDVSRILVLGCRQDEHSIIHVFLCDALDMLQVKHWWTTYFFLFNLEAWGRVELEEMLLTMFNDTETKNGDGSFRLPKETWRFGHWTHTRRPSSRSHSKKRKRDGNDKGGFDGRDENEDNLTVNGVVDNSRDISLRTPRYLTTAEVLRFELGCVDADDGSSADETVDVPIARKDCANPMDRVLNWRQDVT
ncbi:hypothetical protein DACRYDRAFT_101067 [Dacryopinax primogenitus]|uniref:Uncharacterized protein n=1 Tax=Dacryopinax primogenitus (strain DJM 731) TaxID=1858805 RepID=M5FUM0_DACPD|nr:uncharacterized protein DACRYDRAFT_101067 [Dacryopinax primogenitus]EJT99948.1 hypothetical protein DACRYDRAFT_101067 [Dacryopinax primogenitus]